MSRTLLRFVPADISGRSDLWVIISVRGVSTGELVFVFDDISPARWHFLGGRISDRNFLSIILLRGGVTDVTSVTVIWGVTRVTERNVVSIVDIGSRRVYLG